MEEDEDSLTATEHSKSWSRQRVAGRKLLKRGPLIAVFTGQDGRVNRGREEIAIRVAQSRDDSTFTGKCNFMPIR